MQPIDFMVRPEGLEPPTPRSVVGSSEFYTALPLALYLDISSSYPYRQSDALPCITPFSSTFVLHKFYTRNVWCSIAV
jgi:hypothetical protein